MYWFGEIKRIDFNWMDESGWKDIENKKRTFANTSLDEILNLLDNFSCENFDDALAGLEEESGLSLEELRKTLYLLPPMLKRESLEKRLLVEFNKIEILDRFVKLPHGQFKARAIPRGVALHVTAGNIFLGAIDSLLMGLVTKNLSILKVSGQNQFFPFYFAQKLLAFDKKQILSDKFSVLYWKGGDEDKEKFIKSKVSTILAWGGEEMVSSYQKDLPSEVKLLDFGPKLSLQVISKAGLEGKNLDVVASKVVADILPWDQLACASPQNLYLETGIDEEKFLSALEKAFLKAPLRGHLDEDEATEILKEKYRGLYSELMGSGILKSGENHLIHSETQKIPRPSPLHRSLIIKRFDSAFELSKLLEPFSYYLQSCAYLLSAQEKDQFLSALALTGIKRFAPLGTITHGMEGAPHDGRFVLRELVTFIGDEIRAVNYGEYSQQTTDSVALKDHFEKQSHSKGYIFSSGGTTGSPKYVHYSYEEFDFMSDMLAFNFKRQGVKSGMKVANLFVAGNLWSSFLCVEKALEKIGALQLPIGGLCSSDNITMYLQKFKPDVVMGIPSLLVLNAQAMAQQNIELTVPMIFYAGEALSEARRDYLKNIWNVSYFGSAGYASVDAGVIGYQCSYCGPGEHHVFEDQVIFEIINEEAIVTSVARDSMPLHRYHTGDRAEWIQDCLCASPHRRFKLLGRMDDVIQIWSCRLLVSDIETSLSKFNIKTFQLKLTEKREAYLLREKLTLSLEIEKDNIDQDELILDIYHKSRDVKDTISFENFKKDINLELMKPGEITRNPRTGKVSLVLDQRK